MPTFCRHNRLIQNCPICSREQSIEPRAALSSSAPRSTLSRAAATERRLPRSQPASGSAGMRVRRLARGGDDGYRCALAPGLKSSADAERLAEELAFAATRLTVLASEPPGLYATVADPAQELEERLWLGFLIAYLGPLEDCDDPFASIAAVRTPWISDALPDLDSANTGPRAAHDPRRGSGTLTAYRAWAVRAGSQQAAFTGDAGWTPERRFTRAYERLAFPGMARDARYELLVLIGELGLVPMRPSSLALGGDNDVTVAAKRALGIGDPLLLERRALALAEGVSVPLAALDLGLFNWERTARATVGLPDPTPDPATLALVRDGLDL